LIFIVQTRCHGEILELSDAMFFNGTSIIRAGTPQDAAQADIIIITAGKPQKPGETRLDLFATNKAIITDIFTSIKPISSFSSPSARVRCAETRSSPSDSRWIQTPGSH